LNQAVRGVGAHHCLRITPFKHSQANAIAKSFVSGLAFVANTVPLEN
jgi:hypothetical protein